MKSRVTVRTIIGWCLALTSTVATTALLIRAQSGPAAVSSPGTLSDGSTLLANGWRLNPAGRHLAVGTLPLNVVQSSDGRYLVVTNGGLSKPSVSVVDIASWTIKSTTSLDHAWFGLAWHPDGTKLYAAGGQNSVQEFAYADGVLTPARTFNLPAQTGQTFAGGMAVSRDGKMLYVTRVFAMTLSAIDLVSGQVVKTVALPSEPYTVVVSPDGRTVYVSLWGGSRVQLFSAPSLDALQDLGTGEHPNAMVLSADGRRLFIACGSSASVWVYNTLVAEAIEIVSMSLYPDAPPTSTPNSLALSPDGQKLLVANADTNTVGVVDVSNSVHSVVDGFIPTGWYPTAAIFSRDGRQIYILSGKGLAPAPNLFNNGLEKRLAGAVSVVPTPDRTTLAELTRRVYTLTPYSDSIKVAPANVPIGSPIPRAVGGSSPIKHVFYIIRENRTYDQVLGDLSQGNGEPRLTLFGKDVTPNAHAIAQSFVLFDNFYVDADVSYNGHSFSTAAYATDFIEKMWQAYAANRGVPYLAEGGGFLRGPFGNIAAPPMGYIWDYARRARVSVRSYGEFVAHVSRSPAGDVVAVESVPGLRGSVAPAFPGFDLDITDQKRVDEWLKEFREFESNGNLPSLSIIRLGNDHTQGTRPGAPTPRAMIADNDLAVGRVVEAVSNSVYWKDSAILALEDDAQSGPDHVDSHRSVLLVASPFVKRGFTDHTFYTTSAVLRTIELILGLPPMSQYDAAATPLYNALDSTPNLGAYRCSEARVPLDEKNLPGAFGAKESLAMDFADADRTPELLLNDIVWRSVRGANSPMPPVRRSIFVRASSGARDDDD